MARRLAACLRRDAGLWQPQVGWAWSGHERRVAERCGGRRWPWPCSRRQAAWRAAQDAATERRQAFVLADVNGDGCLQLAEVAREMAWRFAALDTDHDQRLARDELVIADDARFVRIDRDGDGKLSFLEVMELKQADLAKADHTGRGCVLVDEVTAFDGAGR